ncbi:hypothetical protein [Aeromicrobium sp. 179-A 4D2 NHS]|uniref:hypothetical protein n=1 Tax=Aeromicrobium sp. 179-A 4D2 NHS TaxID=3142375 RepID=UPI0039A20777
MTDLFTDSAYWAGVVTLPALVALVYAVPNVVYFAYQFVYERLGLFIEFGSVPDAEEKSYSSLTVHRVMPGVRVGHYWNRPLNKKSDWVCLLGWMFVGYVRPLNPHTPES